jgi:hypothetical protein
MKPRLVKVPWKMTQIHRDEDPFQELDTDVWFKHANKAVKPKYFERWGINGPELAGASALCMMTIL